MKTHTRDLEIPRQVVEEFVRRFNKRGAIAIAELYHEDPVNYQVTQRPVEGRAAIREMFERDFNHCLNDLHSRNHPRGQRCRNSRVARGPVRVRFLHRPRQPALPFSVATGTNCRFSDCTVSQSRKRRRSVRDPPPPSRGLLSFADGLSSRGAL